MSTADFEILAEMDRADALVSLAEIQHAAMLAKAMDILQRPAVIDPPFCFAKKTGGPCGVPGCLSCSESDGE